MNDMENIIAECGGTIAVAAAAGVDPSTVSSWKARGRIPADHDASLVGAFPETVTLERLAAARPRRRRSE